ncbi:hypothetical protein [Streptomyces sp. Z26]|uniref:DUF6895 family protein n=1 Tax=Streptomyces sp. Z26 TaxID=2500177 RepID=UPI0019D2BEB8|nr:hypothetical protein [Streptomyces sp. Z26]
MTAPGGGPPGRAREPGPNPRNGSGQGRGNEPGPGAERHGEETPGPPPALLERVSLAALSWLRAHLTDFRLPERVTDPHVDRNTTLKPLGELAQLTLSTLRSSPPGSEQHRLSREMLDFAWRETGRGDLFLSLVRGEPHATYPMELYGAFAEAGLRHAAFEEYARFAVTTRAWQLCEYEPTRALGLFNTLRRMGVATHGSVGLGGTEAAEHAELARRTWLGGLAEPWAFEVHAGYAMTHHVFHVTNWGEAPAQLPADLGEHLARWLPPWLDGCVECEQWDLTGELLAVAACLPEPYARAVPVADAWHAFAGAQNVAGAVAEDGPPPVRETADTFLDCYHSTLVAAFAGVLAADRLRTPASAPAGTGAGTPAGTGGGGDPGHAPAPAPVRHRAAAAPTGAGPHAPHVTTTAPGGGRP